MNSVEFDYQIRTKLARLKSLRAAGNADHPSIQVEMADIRRDLKANKFTDAEIDIRTAAGPQAVEQQQQEAVADPSSE